MKGFSTTFPILMSGYTRLIRLHEVRNVDAADNHFEYRAVVLTVKVTWLEYGIDRRFSRGMINGVSEQACGGERCNRSPRMSIVLLQRRVNTDGGRA